MGCLFCCRRREIEREECEVKKPVLYLYPEKETEIEIQLKLKNSKFVCVYPKFNEKENKWKVKASPNGDISINGKKYPYLFWEANSYLNQDLTKGFIVKDIEAEKFLEEKLKLLGLNEKESCDFITYWLPVLLKKNYLYALSRLKNIFLILNMILILNQNHF